MKKNDEAPRIFSDPRAAIAEVMQHAVELSEKLGFAIAQDDYCIEDLGCPHKPKTLPLGYGGVYFFVYRGEFLKIGKANANSNARYNSQHYGFSVPSTLAKSICADPAFAPLQLNASNIRPWMLANLHRLNVLVKEADCKAVTELVEAVMHYALRPRYEGAIH